MELKIALCVVCKGTHLTESISAFKIWTSAIFPVILIILKGNVKFQILQEHFAVGYSILSTLLNWKSYNFALFK